MKYIEKIKNEICIPSLNTELRQLSNTISTVRNSVEFDEILEQCLFIGTSYNRRIIFCGVGKNANVAAKISETFASLGIPSLFLNANHSTHGDSGFVGDNDIIIHISKSGTTFELLTAATHIKKIKPLVNQFLIHCNPNKIRDDTFNIELCIVNSLFKEADENNLAPTSSTTVLMAVLDSLACGISSYNKFNKEDFLKYHPGGTLGNMLRTTLK